MTWRFPGYDSWLWLAGLIFTLLGLAALVFWSTGCAKPPALSPSQVARVASAAACRSVALKAVKDHDTCPPAQLVVDSDPDCKLAFPEGLSLNCPEFR